MDNWPTIDVVTGPAGGKSLPCVTGIPFPEGALAEDTPLGASAGDDELRSVLIGFNREVGWPVPALSHLADITGESRFRTHAQMLVDYLAAFERGATQGAKPAGVTKTDPFMRQITQGFFCYASMVEGIDHFARTQSHAEAGAWLGGFLRDVLREFRGLLAEGHPLSTTHMHLHAMAIGYERTGDERFLRAGLLHLRQMMESPEWQSPPPQVKPVAMIHRGLVRFLGHAQRTGLLQPFEYAEAPATLE
jgi:hypothetical protein